MFWPDGFNAQKFTQINVISSTLILTKMSNILRTKVIKENTRKRQPRRRGRAERTEALFRNLDAILKNVKGM